MLLSNIRVSRWQASKCYHYTTAVKRVDEFLYTKLQCTSAHIDCYYALTSPVCRTVLLTAGALGVKLNLIHVDTMKSKQQMRPDFLKINPQRTIPAIVDDGFCLWESRAICRYLVDKYGEENNTLYPKDPKARAVVDQRLDFDLGTLYQRYAEYTYPPFFKGVPVDEKAFKRMLKAVKLFHLFLEGNRYSAGCDLTIADFAFTSTISHMEAIGMRFTNYPNIAKWYERVKSISPYYKEVIENGTEESKKHINKYKVNKNIIFINCYSGL